MIIGVDPDSPVPSFEQLRQQFVELISGGRLAPGDRLPTIRQLASDLDLAPGTVARVYRELEADGYVITRRRHGTSVAPPRLQTKDVAEEALAEAARSYVLSARRLGMTLEETTAAIRSGWERVKDDPVTS